MKLRATQKMVLLFGLFKRPRVGHFKRPRVCELTDAFEGEEEREVLTDHHVLVHNATDIVDAKIKSQLYNF